MNILHVYKDFDPPVHGGIEGYVSLMCKHQSKYANVEALTCSRSFGTRIVERNGTKVTEVGELGRFQSAPFSPAFPWHMRRMAREVMVVHVPNPTAELGFLISRPKTKLVVRYHSDVIRQATAMKFYKPFLMKFLRKADIILVTSEQYLKTSKTLQGVEDKCRVVPLGIELDEFKCVDEQRVRILREQYGGDFVLFVGKHRYYKGIKYLVQAAKDTQGTIVVVGDGPERSRCTNLAKELGVKVEFPGELDRKDLLDHLHACSVFAFPSIERSEAFGISMLEAHACGKPVVSTTIGTGVEFVNLHGQTGTNVPPRDPRALADALNDLLENKEKARGFGQYAKNRVEKDFDVAKVAHAEYDIYRELI